MTESISPLPKANILVVDDTPENLRLLSSILSEQGYKVRSALNGQMALRGAQLSPPDLILLDVNMPLMNGYEVCRQLKEHHETRQIPVIFISALDGVEDKVKAFEMGGVDYVTKPFQLQEVLARIHTHLTLRQLQQQLQSQNQLLQAEIEERQRVEAALQLANQELLRLSTRDELTQVANRRHFNACLDQWWWSLGQTQEDLSLLICDVDYFKSYNDTCGHLAGDRCLQQVAQILQSALNSSQDLVARYGGDEFMILLPYASEARGEQIAESIQEKIRQLRIPHVAHPVCGQVSLSIGLASLKPSLESPPDLLVGCADQALYTSKAQGRNCITAYSSLPDSAREFPPPSHKKGNELKPAHTEDGATNGSGSGLDSAWTPTEWDGSDPG
jgi:diguanylate cyclase (GGDEF)-like protein